MKNRAAYMTDLDKMEIREIEMPSPKAKEVLVELEYVGICGSDVHYFHDGRCGSYVVDGDFMLGHECAGTVVELGEGVEFKGRRQGGSGAGNYLRTVRVLQERALQSLPGCTIPCYSAGTGML